METVVEDNGESKRQAVFEKEINHEHGTLANSEFAGKPVLLKLLVSNSLCGLIIGRSGQSIGQHEANYNIKLTVSAAGVVYPGTSLRAVVMRGTVSSVIQFHNYLIDKAVDYKDDGYTQGYYVCRFIVLNETAGSLIGRGGEIVRSISSTFNVKLLFSNKDDSPVDGERIVNVSGKSETVRSAMEKIVELLSADEANMLNAHVKYKSDAPQLSMFPTGVTSGGPLPLIQEATRELENVETNCNYNLQRQRSHAPAAGFAALLQSGHFSLDSLTQLRRLTSCQPNVHAMMKLEMPLSDDFYNYLTGYGQAIIPEVSHSSGSQVTLSSKMQYPTLCVEGSSEQCIVAYVLISQKLWMPSYAGY